MGTMKTAALVALWALLLGSILFAAEAENDEDKQVIHVVGKVQCQDCSKSWNDWNGGGNPIPGSKVSVTCLDSRKMPVYYESDTTDADGQYDIVITKKVYGKTLDLKRCVVRLVYSGDSGCKVPTNWGKGKTGVWLRQPSVLYRDLVKYSIGVFFYSTPVCGDDSYEDDGRRF